MSENRRIVEKMMELYNAMDADGLAEVLQESVKHTAPGSDFGTDLEGQSTIITYFKENVFPSFHKVKFETVNLYEDPEANVVVVEWRSHLWPKTGKNYSNTGAFVIEVKEGKIDWVREYFDTEKSSKHVN